MRQASHCVLVVQPDDLTRQQMSSALASVGFIVMGASSFEAARGVLNTAPVDVLLTDLRLGEYNGLHLVLLARSVRPDVAAVVIAPTADGVLQRDADVLGATFVLRPVSVHELRGAVIRTVQRDRQSTDPLRPPFERRHGDRRQSARAAAAEVDQRVRDRRDAIDDP